MQLYQLKQIIDKNKHFLNSSAKDIALELCTIFKSETFDILFIANCIYYSKVISILIKLINCIIVR